MQAVIPELVARQAVRTPAAPAVVHGRRQLSYADLDGRADLLADDLRRRGVGPGSVVGVCLRRGPELVVALLAVWKAGGAYVPLDPGHPPDRLAWVLSDTAARVVLTDGAGIGWVPDPGQELIRLDTAPPTAVPAGGWPPAAVAPDDAAYVIYTSGSTGPPKGVVVTHAGIANRVNWTVRVHELGPADRVLQKTALSFDAAGWEIFAPLVSGGTVVLAPDGVERDPAALVRAVGDYHVTVLQVVPSVLRLLVDEPGWERCDSLRLLFSAGEPLYADLCQRLRGQVDVVVWNTYGPTECSIDVTAQRFNRVQQAGAVPIGRPIDGMRVLVLTPGGELAPIGVPGELYVGGVGVARGYLARPALTAERFVPDPYGEPGARLYRTGDRARWRRDGRLEYLGRLDQQLKINGVRVEPGEVEAALRALPELAAATVTGFVDGRGDPRLAAYLVYRGDPMPTERLRGRLRAALPEPLIPSVFVPLPALPLTASGKVDRAALPAVRPESLVDRAAYVAPRTPAERTVAEAWSTLLSIEKVGALDNFFRLGGSSLLMTRLANRLSRVWHQEVPVRELYAAPTVAAQARLISREGRDQALPPIRPVPRDRPLPLSYGQYRIWFLDRMNPGSAEWATPVLLRLPAGTAPGLVRRALAILADRHEVLRTLYIMDDGEPRQVVQPPGPVELSVVDLTREELSGRLSAEIGRGFDLARGPVWRALLGRLAGEEQLLLVTVHHIASDGWSSVVLDREIRQVCRELAAGQRPELPELPVQYGDFAVWQREYVAGELLERQLSFWREALAGLEPTELVTDRPRPAQRQTAGGTVEFSVPAALTEAVAELGRRHGATPFMVLLTAFYVLLARYTGRWDLAVGTPVAERARPELESAVGCFLNSLVLRCRLSPELSFEQALDRVRRTCLSALAHRDLPFERLVEELQPDRDPSRTPLYQVMFELVEEGLSGTAMRDADRAAFLQAWRTAKTDLTLYLHQETNGGLTGVVEYAVGLFDGLLVGRLVGHFVRLLAGVVADPGVRLSGVEFLSVDELGLVVGSDAVGGGFVGGEGVGCVSEVFEGRVAAARDAVAVVCDGVELTYGEVNEWANRLAHHLRGLGVGADSVVGVCVERGPELVPALLGVLKAGGGYLPLDPVYPPERWGFMLADAGVSVVVTAGGLVDALAGVFSGSLVVLDGDRDRAVLAGRPGSDPVPVAGPDNLAYVIYTSGSTGRPKGVCVTHANVLRLLACGQELYGFDGSDVWPLFHSYAFDVSVWEMWGALLTGGRLVVVPASVTRTPEEFLDLLVRERVTVLNQTPSAFRGLVAAAAAGDERVDRLALRLVVFAGEKLEISELAPWVAVRGFDRPVLANMYGITETTVHSTFHRVVAEDLAGVGNPIGVPLADLRIYLLDAAGNLVPVGVPGEIYVGGPGVARGYLNRPGLTAQRFVPDRFGPAGGRLYRSGDLARRLPDGRLQFLGRVDDQVKIRGYRVELGEVQAALQADPRVADAVVVVRRDSAGDKQLVGYYVPAGPTPPDPRQLRATLAGSLPDYLIPSGFVPVDQIPLTANGKLDRHALPAPDRDTLHPAAYQPPRTPVEERIANAWQEVLDLDRVSIDDNFFDIGGDSIRAVALVGALREAGHDVAVRDVFDHRTVARLAELVTGRPALVEQPALVEPFALIRDEDRRRLPAGVVDAYPLSQVQSGMVVEMLANRERNTYHNITTFRLRDDQPFSEAPLRDAARAAVARHEVLRTSIDLMRYSLPMQLVHPAAELPVELHDLRGLGAAEQDRVLREFTARERARLFDLDRPPLLRITAHVCDANIWWISMTECHAILEGWSYHSLLMELLDHYRQARDGLSPAAAPLPALRYADFIAAELRSLESPEDRAYWRGVVEEYPKLAIPPGWGDGDAAGEKADSYRVWVALDHIQEALRRAAATARVSLKSVLLAAHLKVMSMLTDQPAFYTGLVCNARPEVLGADRVHGLYLNTLPFLHDGAARAAGTWRELVQRTFAREVELWPHRRFPMPVIQRELADEQRLVDVRFSYLNFRQVDADRVDLAASIDDSPTEFGLAVHGVPGAVVLTADPRILGKTNLDRLADMHRLVLEAIAADLDGDARDTYLPEPERHQLVAEWNATGTGWADERSVPELFEEQVRRVPGATAVCAAADSVSYADLDARANRLAHLLRVAGVGPESVVGVLLDRGPDLVASLLGVWKAGGAYLPMDPSYPADRLAYMLADAEARVVVTEPAHAGRFDAASLDHRVVIDRDGTAVEALPAEPPARRDDPDRLAYVIYTSGSTGRPKGVQITHRGLGNHLRWAAGELAGRGTTGAPLFSSVAFDLVVPNLWAPLVTGQPVHVLPGDLDLADLGKSLVEHGPFSFIKLTPGHLDVLARQLDEAAVATLAGVIVVAGEALPAGAGDRWLRVLGPGRLVNEYGPTEASVGTCVFPIVEPSRAEIVPIGRPLPNLTMHVLDGALRPLPVGVVGELYVGGTGVARGYAGQPALTARRFVPDPFGQPGARLYRTGDQVRRWHDGTVEFVGRVDDQLKIRGYRIEPGEIRAVLLDHPDLADAIVVAHDPAEATDSGRDERQLVAYCVAAAGREVPAADELLWHCRTRLPDYLVPSRFLPLPRLPLNANGKLDRRALPAPEPAAVPTGQVAPRTDLEQQIAQVWCAVLELDQVGVHDNFFDLGGHSIRAVALVGALRASGLDVAVRDVFEHRTVAALAAAMAQRVEPADDGELVAPYELISEADRAGLPKGVCDAYPLSQVQLGMVVEMLADEQLNNYHNTTLYQIRDDQPFVLPALREAVRLAIERHELLRTSVDLIGYSVPMQLVHAVAEPSVSMLDLRGLAEAEQAAAVRRFVARERATRFDLDKPPLLRITALVRGPRSWRLSFTQLHAITEGWSAHTLLMQLLDNYRRIRDGRTPEPAEPVAVRYADFIAAELRSLTAAEDRGYWQRIVDGYPKLTLPAGWGDDPTTSREDYQVAFSHDDFEAGLRRLATEARASLKSVLHAAHLKVMSMLTHEPVFASGLVCNARPELPGADRVYGMHLNTLPFAHDRTARTWLELVERTFAREVELWPHRRFPMPAVQRELGDGTRLIDVLFTYHDFHQVDTGLVDMEAGEGDDSTEFALGVACTPRFLGLRTNTHAMSRANARRLAGMYRAVLAAMAADPRGDARAAHLPPEEYARLAAAGPGRADQPAVTSCLHEVFEEQAATRPHAVAVSSGPDELSYAEVNARANRLAHHLRGLGVGAESLVGVCLEPGIELVPTLLGVLKAGGGYLPLPPSYPAERIRFLLDDTTAPVVVTDTARAAALADVHDAAVVVLERDAAAVARLPATDPAPLAGPDNLAYVIYTSGSTGTPKGVTVTHANVRRLFIATADRMVTGPDEAWGLLHSYAFDASVWEMWGALLHGGRVVVVPPDTAESPADLLALIERQGVTVIGLSPVAYRSLVAAAGGDHSRLSRVPLRAVTFGGDRLDATDLTEWVDSQGLGRTSLAQAYGPTECTVHVTYHNLEPGDLESASGIPIGRAVDDMWTHVLDVHGRQVPVGAPGELCVGGAGLARGYFNRPALTAERFVPDPFGPPGSRYYRTGDLVRARPGGNLDFLGRTDQQIKVRGYRVEPGEIQAVLAGHRGVREAVVTAHGFGPGDRRLVGYYVPATEPPPSSAELAEHCAARLPDYLVPVAFVPLSRVPLTASGKLDQQALPTPDRASLSSSTEYVAPRTATEQLLADIWSRVLGVARVGADDRFFDLGGDSTTVLRVMAAARAAGLSLSVRLLYRYGSVAELARALDQSPEGGGSSAAPDRTGSASMPKSTMVDGRSDSTPAVPSLPSPLAVMTEHHVPGATVVVLRSGELASSHAYGVRDARDRAPVTVDTLFRVASVSKQITALGVLRLVTEGQLDLDEDVNSYLRSWRVPQDDVASPVTTRDLLANVAGLSPEPDHEPYRHEGPVPTALDALHGRAPARTPPVTLLRPSGRFEKNRVNYLVLEQLMVDVTGGTPFPELMKALVFDPLGMANSSFDPAFHQVSGRPVARGHDALGVPIPALGPAHPATAAGGLWTTAEDLAAAELEIRRGYLGKPALLHRSVARQMMEPTPGTLYGLSTIVDFAQTDLDFGIVGEFAGYWAGTMCRMGSGDGFVLLTNGDLGREVATFVIGATGASAGFGQL